MRDGLYIEDHCLSEGNLQDWLIVCILPEPRVFYWYVTAI